MLLVISYFIFFTIEITMAKIIKKTFCVFSNYMFYLLCNERRDIKRERDGARFKEREKERERERDGER